MMKKTTLVLLLMSLSGLATAVPRQGDEFGITYSISRLDAEFLTGPYGSSLYDRTFYFNERGISFSSFIPFGDHSSIGAYLQNIKNSQPAISSDFLDVGLEVRRHIGAGFCGILFNFPVAKSIQIRQWPVSTATFSENASPMSLGLSFGYALSDRWSLRFSTIYNKEYVEYTYNGHLTPEIAFFTTSRSFLTLVYHFREKGGEGRPEASE